MVTRRSLFRSASVLAGADALAACAEEPASPDYEQTASEIWRASAPAARPPGAVARELVRCATLAPSSHNTQCWKFRLAPRSIAIRPDFARRCPVVDPDDHHLFTSLGCATENPVQAAAAHGFMAHPVPVDQGVDVVLEPTRPAASARFQAIMLRQSTRGEFDGRPLSAPELTQLSQAGTGAGVHVLLLAARPAMEQVLALVASGNAAQLRDPAFVHELKTWIRFSEYEAVRTGDGLFARCSGNPALPRWLGSPLLDLFLTADAENDKYARHVRSSAGIAVFASERNHPQQWIEVGRAFERFALQAAAMNVRTAHLNQPVEVPALRGQLAGWLGIAGWRPDLVVRFGRGPAMPRSLRRPLDAALQQV
ncbi:MAG: Acg family FMN-binding oxidoreductase [Ramlibacter sp.]